MSDHADAAGRSGAGEIFGIDRRKALITLGLAVILVAGAVALVGQISEFGQMLAALRKADKAWFPVALLGQLLAYAGYILAYRNLARANGGPRLPYWTTTRIVFVSFGAYVLGSAPGGLAVDYWAIHRAGTGVHEAARRVLALNTLQWGVLGAFAALAAATVLAGRGPNVPLAMTLSWVVLVPAAIAAALWVSSPARADRLASLETPEPDELGASPGRWARWGWAKLRKLFADAVGGVVLVRHVLARPLRYPGGLAGFPIYWGGQLLILYGALRAFTTEDVAFAAFALAFITGYVATALPLPAGGSGAIEATLALTLHLVGIPLAEAILATLTYRIFTFWLPIAPALAFLQQVRALNDELPETPRDEPD